MRRLLGGLVALAFVLLLVAQFVPYGRVHANPAVRQEPIWDSSNTRDLTSRACFDCHSNATFWPWYSNVAPASWLVTWDVDRGRRKMNFSEWDRPQREVDDAPETTLEGKMPPRYYLPLHPEANLSASDRRSLAQGLATTLGVGLEGEGDD